MLETNSLWLLPLLQFFIAFGLLNVWVVRSGKATKYRGAGAQNLKEEFSAYGLPTWFMYLVGFLKVSIALVLIISLLVPTITNTLELGALVILSVLMLGAISMHVKVKDSLIKTIPAIIMLSMSALSIFLIL